MIWALLPLSSCIVRIVQCSCGSQIQMQRILPVCLQQLAGLAGFHHLFWSCWAWGKLARYFLNFFPNTVETCALIGGRNIVWPGFNSSCVKYISTSCLRSIITDSILDAMEAFNNSLLLIYLAMPACSLYPTRGRGGGLLIHRILL